MKTLAVIIARMASDFAYKNIMPLNGKPVFYYTINEVRESTYISASILSTDSATIAAYCTLFGQAFVVRPPELCAYNTNWIYPVRHAVKHMEKNGMKFNCVVVLYGNVPVRDVRIIDRAIMELHKSKADSVISVARAIPPKHPLYAMTINQDGFIVADSHVSENRQRLGTVYYPDPAVLAITRKNLFACDIEPERMSWRGKRCKAIEAKNTIEIDTYDDYLRARGLLECEEK